MLLAQGVGLLVVGAVSIYAVRNLTPTAWGHLSTALALIALFTIFSAPGLPPLVLREMTSDPRREAEILGMSLQALAWTAGVAAVALVAITAALGYPDSVLVLVLVLAPLLVLTPALATFAAAFNARSKLAYVAVFQTAQSLVYGSAAVVVIATALGVTGLAVVTVGAALVATVLALLLLRGRLGIRPQFGQPRRQMWLLLRAAIPIAGIGLVGVVYDRVDILMLSVLSNARNVALYSVPSSFVRLSWVLPSVIAAAFFPLLSRRLETNRSEAEYLFFLVVRVFLFLSLPISLFLAISSPTLLPLVYGGPYARSVGVLQIMAWTSVLGFQNYVLWYGVLAARKEHPVLFIQLAGLLANVILNAALIPPYGPRGAAASLVVSDLLVVVGMTVLIHRDLFRVPLAQLLMKPAGAGVVAVPIAVLVAIRTPIGGALIGATAYVILLLVFRYVTIEEWRPLTAVMREPFARMRHRRAAST
jgi:O-antigen/teichoic acid export membrane protein